MKQSILTSSYMPAAIIALIGISLSVLPIDRIDRSDRLKLKDRPFASDVRNDLNRVNEMAIIFDRIEGSKKRLVYTEDGREFEAFSKIKGIVGEGVKNVNVDLITKAQAAQALDEQPAPLNDIKAQAFREGLKGALLANGNQYDMLKR